MVLFSGSVWYRLPVKIENLDRLMYCNCGYSEVQFKDGVITMVSHKHADPKTGDRIGSYSVVGNMVEMTLDWNGECSKETLEVDHFGLIAAAPALQKYLAIDSHSQKIYVYDLLDKLESIIR